MSNELVLKNLENGVLTLSINRPDKLNALNAECLSELNIVVAQALDTPDVRVIILTGSGEKAFVAGADIESLSTMNGQQARSFSDLGQSTFRRIETANKPVIAMIQGYALGGGCELAMACHLRFVSTKAVFGQPEIHLGLIPGFGGTQRMARLCGRAKALELCLSGQNIDSQQALAIGLVNEIYEPDELTTKVTEFASRLAKSAPLAIQGILTTVNHGLEMPLDQALQHESAWFGLTVDTEDGREGTLAFLEKRKPNFKGE